jgi:hypothetical protein
MADTTGPKMISFKHSVAATDAIPLIPTGTTTTTVLLRYALEAGQAVYYTAAYAQPSSAATTATLGTTAEWTILVSLPGGLTTPLMTIQEAVWPNGAAMPDADPPPPPPGHVHS